MCIAICRFQELNHSIPADQVTGSSLTLCLQALWSANTSVAHCDAGAMDGGVHLITYSFSMKAFVIKGDSFMATLLCNGFGQQERNLTHSGVLHKKMVGISHCYTDGGMAPARTEIIHPVQLKD